MRDERKQLGYEVKTYPQYVVRYGDVGNYNQQKIQDADIVISGAAPNKLLKSRIQDGLPVFRYEERPLKHELKPANYPARWIKWHIKNPPRAPIYMLCASAYTPYDYSRFGLFENKAYKWGYFPETKYYDVDKLFKRKHNNEILWCGRFLDWKHPDDAILIAKRLKSDNYDFQMNLIGSGEMQDKLLELIKAYELEDRVHLLGSMHPDQVRERMENAGIYLFTSDRQEGWGAVLNESMNSGCAVVASHEIGSVPYLIKDGNNGLIYRSGDIDGMYRKVETLLKNPEEQRRLGETAYTTITEEWNAGVAAERLVNLAQHVLHGEESPDLYESGPCSKAEIIKDYWFE